jgi:hypothetical protein
MGKAFGFIMLIVVVGCGAYLYMRQAQAVTTDGSTPQTTIDVTAARGDLLALARAEQSHFASTGKYVSLDELRTGGEITIPTRPAWSYAAETSETGFRIIASYSGADPKAPKRMSVDQSMAITNQ